MLRKGLEKNVMGLKKSAEKKSGGSKTPADLRLNKDLSELDLQATTAQVDVPDKDNLRELLLTLKPKEGYYRGGTFKFQVSVPAEYPHQPPKVVYELDLNGGKRIFHPNIDEDGRVCLNILRADWKPVLTVKAVVFGMELLFIEPNPDDPLNKDAAKLLRDDPGRFARTVQASLR